MPNHKDDPKLNALVDEMIASGKTDEEIIAFVNQYDQSGGKSTRLQKAWEFVNRPLTDTLLDAAARTNPSMASARDRLNAAREETATAHPFIAGLGEMVNSSTSPLQLALTGTAALAPVAKAAGAVRVGRLLNVPSRVAAGGMVGHGIYKAATAEDIPEALAGGAEAGLGLLGNDEPLRFGARKLGPAVVRIGQKTSPWWGRVAGASVGGMLGGHGGANLAGVAGGTIGLYLPDFLKSFGGALERYGGINRDGELLQQLEGMAQKAAAARDRAGLADLDAAIAATKKEMAGARGLSSRRETRIRLDEQKADLDQFRKDQKLAEVTKRANEDAERAARLKAQTEGKQPTSTIRSTESGVTPGGERISKTTTYSDKDTGGGGSSDPFFVKGQRVDPNSPLGQSITASLKNQPGVHVPPGMDTQATKMGEQSLRTLQRTEPITTSDEAEKIAEQFKAASTDPREARPGVTTTTPVDVGAATAGTETPMQATLRSYPPNVLTGSGAVSKAAQREIEGDIVRRAQQGGVRIGGRGPVDLTGGKPSAAPIATARTELSSLTDKAFEPIYEKFPKNSRGTWSDADKALIRELIQTEPDLDTAITKYTAERSGRHSGHYAEGLAKKEARLQSENEPDATTTASVPFMMTRKMEADLRSRGYKDAFINQLSPADAWDILNRK